MTKLIFPYPLLGELRAILLADRGVETCAIVYARPAGGRLVAVRYDVPPASAYAERTVVSASLTPEYVLEVVNQARKHRLSCVFAHSHPRDQGVPQFSRIDDVGERRIAAFLADRHPQKHLALVASPGGLRARVIGSDEAASVYQVGRTLECASGGLSGGDADGRFDRQVRAFGRDGQVAIGSLTVALVGLGGTGSVTAEQLAHLGVSKFILADFDTLEATNLNRVVGATPEDVGVPKVEIARRLIQRVNPSAAVEVLNGDIADDAVAKGLLHADVILSCTDSHASRAILGQIAYQYLIPTIDMGVSISVREGRLAYITGRVQLLAPGLPCLACMELLNSEQIRRELLTPEARAGDPYIVGFHEPQPSVVSLNSTMASLAVTMFIGLVTSAPVEARMQIYDGIAGTVRNTSAAQDPHCFVCSGEGALARGDSWPLPTRRD